MTSSPDIIAGITEPIIIPKFINKNKEVKVIKKVTQTKTTKEINHKII